jgi:hypothetical protein
LVVRFTAEVGAFPLIGNTGRVIKVIQKERVLTWRAPPKERIGKRDLISRGSGSAICVNTTIASGLAS